MTKRRETIAERSKRLVSVTGGPGGDRPAVAPPPGMAAPVDSFQHPSDPVAPPRRRSPTRLAAAAAVPTAPPQMKVPQYTQAQKQAFLAQEQQRMESEARAAMQTQQAPAAQPPVSPQGLAQLRSFVGPEPEETEDDPPVHVSATETKPQSTLSSWDREVLEMASQLDPAGLVLDGEVLTELEIHEVLSVTVRSLKKGDWTEVSRDVNDFRRGIDTEVESADGEMVTKTIYPFPDEIQEFKQQRILAQGILGVNGQPYPGHWSQRVSILEELPQPVYEAILREYTKFLQAVGTLFPDKPTKEKMDELRLRLGKAQAHH